jgi:hypothetical protein
LPRADYFSVLLAARASVFLTMPRRFLALMPLAVIENPERSAAGQIRPILEGSSARARWHGASRLRTPGQDGHLGFLLPLPPESAIQRPHHNNHKGKGDPSPMP